MQIDQKWVERNLGFDPIDMPPPASTFAFSRAAQTSDPEDLQREIITLAGRIGADDWP